jgi:serine/threonine protein kinase
MQSSGTKRPERPKTILPSYTLKQFKGSGTYNCVFQLSDTQALRIAPYEKKTKNGFNTKTTILRGIALSALITSMRHLGPARIKVDKYHIIRKYGTLLKMLDHPDRLLLCSNFLELVDVTKFTYIVQEIEYLGGGTWDTPRPPLMNEQMRFCVFSLIWFFYVGQAEAQLYHGDMKGGNVLMRTYDSPQRFVFTLGKYDTFTFDSDMCPVVIDWDLGNVLSSSRITRRAFMGTVNAAPPEYVEFSLDPEKGTSMRRAGEAYDWWTVGYVIMELFINQLPRYHTLLREMNKELYRSVPDEHKKDNTRWLYTSQAIQAALFNLDEMLPLSVREAPSLPQTYGLLKTVIRTFMDKDLRVLLCALMHPIPEMRHVGYNPWIHLRSPYFVPFRSKTTPTPELKAATPNVRYYEYGEFTTLAKLREPVDETRITNLMDRMSIKRVPELAAQIGGICSNCQRSNAMTLCGNHVGCKESVVYCGQACAQEHYEIHSKICRINKK